MIVLNSIFNAVNTFIILIIGYGVIRFTLEQIVESFMTLVI